MARGSAPMISLLTVLVKPSDSALAKVNSSSFLTINDGPRRTRRVTISRPVGVVSSRLRGW